MSPPASQDERLNEYQPQIDELFARCLESAPNFGVTAERFRASVNRSLTKFLNALPDKPAVQQEALDFLNQLQTDDLFLALGCADGSERAWWEFDQQHRSYLERLVRHLAKSEVDAEEVIGSVYLELYGSKFADGARVSKFASYSGRGSLRGWLRTVVWHTLVDQHRVAHDEVSLDELTENVGEGSAHPNFARAVSGGDSELVEEVTRNKYRTATMGALGTAFASLEEHEKLLLLYYHAEQLKLREIAHLVANETSPLRRWLQRKWGTTANDPQRRIHESTVMRWLEKCYSKVLQLFKAELESKYELSNAEVEICFDLVSQDLGSKSLFQDLRQ